MFKARNCDVIVLCGLMVLIAAGSSAATPMGRRAQVPLGDLMCRLDKVNKMDAATASQLAILTVCTNGLEAKT